MIFLQIIMVVMIIIIEFSKNMWFRPEWGSADDFPSFFAADHIEDHPDQRDGHHDQSDPSNHHNDYVQNNE